MGSTNSHLQHQQQPMLMDHQMPPAIMHQPHESTYQPQYPDMNQIFKGIPKMMQVADDMHRMTNYMQDLRNMMAICSFITTVALIIFLVIRVLQNRKTTKRRRRTNNNVRLLSFKQRTDESEQSSLSISRPSNYRHYHSARPVDNWTHKIEMDRMIAYGPPDSTSTRQTNLMSAQGTPGATANAAGGPIHHGSHGLLLNNRAALTATPEHHPHHPQQHHSHSHHQNPHQQYNNVSPLHESQSGPPGAGGNVNNGSTNGNNSPCPTPTSSGHPTSIIMPMPIQNAPSQQPNGQLKRLDPVKLVVDEMPYMEDNSENDEQH